METLEQREPLESLMESLEPAVMMEPTERNHGIVETLEQSETLESMNSRLGPAVMWSRANASSKYRACLCKESSSLLRRKCRELLPNNVCVDHVFSRSSRSVEGLSMEANSSSVTSGT